MGHGAGVESGADAPVIVVPDAQETAARAALPRGDAGWRALFEQAPIGKAVVALDGTWLRVNPALCELTGYTEQELLAGRFHDITHPDDLTTDLHYVAECVAGVRDRYEMDKRYVRADGALIWVTLSVSVVRDDSGAPSYFISQIRDITDRVTAQELLEEALAMSEAANATLREADALKDHLLSVTSHELRTPLTSILGFAKTLHTRWDAVSEPQRREAVSAIFGQARRLKHMVDDLLLLSAHQARVLLWEPAALPVGELATLMSHRHPQVAVEVASDIAGEVAGEPAAVVMVDLEHLHGIVDRLIDNAYRHGAAPVTVAFDAPGDGSADVILTVADQGPGVPESFVRQLFRRFEQADTRLTRTAEGAGLGLAAVAAIAQVAGMPVWYEPNRPAGARFRLRLAGRR